MNPEPDIQFLARMIVATREGNQIASADAQRLNNIAQYGDSLEDAPGRAMRTTMPEERRSGEQLPNEAGIRDVVRG